MLHALVFVAALGLTQGDNAIATPSGLSANDSPRAGATILARGGRERIDPFAEIKERRRQEAKEKREREQHAPKEASQDQAN